MKTKALFWIFCSAIMILLNSCDKTEKRLVPGQNVIDEFLDYYIIKEVDGKKMWGLEGCTVYPNRGILIPVEYDSIAPCEKSNGKYLASYKALKDGLWYAYSGSSRLNAPGFTSYENIDYFSPTNGLEWKINTPNGVYGMYSASGNAFGPYEDIYPGAAGHFFKKNGKWGYIYHDYDKDEIKEFLPAEYESIIEVSSGNSAFYKNNYFLAKKDGKWTLFNREKSYPRPSAYSGLLFINNEKPRNHSLNTLLKWYNRFPEGGKVLQIEYRELVCSKHPSKEVGVMWDN